MKLYFRIEIYLLAYCFNVLFGLMNEKSKRLLTHKQTNKKSVAKKFLLSSATVIIHFEINNVSCDIFWFYVKCIIMKLCLHYFCTILFAW